MQARGQLRLTWRLYAESPQSGEISPSDGTGGITVGDLSTQSIIKAFSICPIPTCSPARDDGGGGQHWTHLRCEGSKGGGGALFSGIRPADSGPVSHFSIFTYSSPISSITAFPPVRSVKKRICFSPFSGRQRNSSTTLSVKSRFLTIMSLSLI